MLVHIIADFGHGDLAFAEVVQRLRLHLPEAEPVLTPVPPFATLAAGFCVAQLGLNEAPPDTLIFHNVAPRIDNEAARADNDGERLAYALLPGGVKAVGVNAGYAFSFVKGEARDMRFVEVGSAGSQFRSRDLFPQAFAKVARGEAGALAGPLSADRIPDVPVGRVAYVDGFGNLKTTLRRPHGPALGSTLRIHIGSVSREATVAGGAFSVPQGGLAFSPGSSGWPTEGGQLSWMELFLRGGSAWELFGRPSVGEAIRLEVPEEVLGAEDRAEREGRPRGPRTARFRPAPHAPVPSPNRAGAPRMTLREKLGYGVSDVGASLSYNAVNFFFLFFLVDIVGLRPALAGSALLVGRVFDAVTDPLMGALSDRTRTRWGRRMPYVWAGLLPLGASFALLWLVPGGGQVRSFVLAALALCLHATLYTMVQVPTLALTPELAPGYAERTELTGYRVGFGTLASLVAAAAPPLIVALFDPAEDLAQTGRQGWVMMGLLFGAVITLSYLIMACNVRERPGTPRPIRRFVLRRELGSALAIFGFRHVLGMFVLVTLGLGIISSMLPFYLGSGLRLGATEQTLMLGLLFVTAIAALPLWNRLASRHGKKAAFAAGLALLALAVMLLSGLAPPGLSALLFALTVLAGLGVSTVLLFPWAMLPDVLEFDELETGERREGLVYAIFTFGQKTAFALGVFLNGQAQELSGYDPGASMQTGGAVLGLKLMVGPAAALVFLLALVLVWRFPITRARHEAATAALAKRRQAAG